MMVQSNQDFMTHDDLQHFAILDGLPDVTKFTIIEAFEQLTTKDVMDLAVFKHQIWKFRLDYGLTNLEDIQAAVVQFKKNFPEVERANGDLVLQIFGNQNVYNRDSLFGEAFGIFSQLKDRTTGYKPTQSLLFRNTSTQSISTTTSAETLNQGSLKEIILNQYGDMTVREIIEKLEQNLGQVSEAKRKLEETVGVKIEPTTILNVVTPVLLYRGLLKVYDKYTSKDFDRVRKFFENKGQYSANNFNDVEKLLIRERFIFRSVAAPLLVLGLMTSANAIGKTFFKVDINQKVDDESSSGSIAMAAPFLLLQKLSPINTKSYNPLRPPAHNYNTGNGNITPNNQGPEIKNNWLKKLVKIVSIISSISILVIFCYKKKDIIWGLLNNVYTYKIFIIFFLILSILALLYFIITLTLFVKYSRAQDKNNIPAPEYAPTVILNWLNEIKALSTIKQKNVVIDYYSKNIMVYILCILICFMLLFFI